jgi:O-antigen/teichoic acid export membrane protein
MIPIRDEGMIYLIRKSSYALFFRIGSFAAAYLFMLVVGRMLGPAAWGNFTLSFTIVQVLAIVALWGLDNLIVRTLARLDRQDTTRLASAYFQSLYPVFLFSLILSLVMYFSAPWLAANVFSKPWLAGHLQTGSFILLPWALMLFHAGCFRGLQNMTGFTIFRMSAYLVAALIMYVSTLRGVSLSPVMVFMISIFIVMLVAVYSWFKFSGIRLRHLIKPFDSRQLLITATPMLITGSVFFILGWADNLFLGIFRSETEVGIYDAAFKLAAAPAIVLVAINAIQAPVFSGLYHRGEMEKLKESVQKGSKLLFITSVPISLMLWLAPEFWLGIFGKDFRAGANALMILTAGSLVNSLTGSVGILLQMTGRQKQYNYIVSSAALLNILLNILLIPSLGIIGAAIASATAKILQNSVAAWYVYRVYNFATLYLPFIASASQPGKHKGNQP